MSKFCTSCGRELRAGQRFCVACGKPVEAPTAGVAPRPVPPVPPIAPPPASPIAPPPASPIAPAPAPPTAPPEPAREPAAAPPLSDAEALASIPTAPPKRRRGFLRIFFMVLGGMVVLLFLLVGLALVVGDEVASDWQLKSGEGQSLFAVAGPIQSTLNLKAAALACEIVDGAKIFHLQLYPSGEGPLLPTGANAGQLKDQPRVRLEIDGAVIQASIYFAGEFAVVANQIANGRPVLTPAVGAALEKGDKLTVRLDLVRDQRGDAPFDAYAVFSLAGGRQSIAAVRRRCGQ